MAGRDCTGRTFLARVSQLPNNTIEQKVRAVLLDASGNGLFMVVDSTVLYWGTVTGGYGANPTYTVVYPGVSVDASGSFHFKLVHTAANATAGASMLTANPTLRYTLIAVNKGLGA